MGIKHYQVAVQNIYAANLSRISNEVKQQITTDRLPGGTQKSEAVYVELAVSKMKQAIKTGLANEVSLVGINGKANASFSLHSIDYFESTKEDKILIKVEGNENGKKLFLVRR